MNRRTPRWVVVSVALVVAMAGMFGIATGVQAGSGPANNSSFEFFALPTILTVGNDGIAWGVFTAASGSGSATHVVVSITLPSGVSPVPAYTSSGCSDDDGDGTWLCDVGTVGAGATVKRFVGFTSSTPGDYTFSSFATWDKGSSGARGGGGSNRLPETGSLTRLVTVVAAGHPDRAGTCTGTAETPPVSSANPTSTKIAGGTAAFPLPCNWGFVGENPPSGPAKSEVSFFAFPKTNPNSPVEWVVSVFNTPVPFKDLKVFFKADYDGVASTSFAGADLLQACNADGTIPEGPQRACLKSLVKNGGGAIATIVAEGTGADPGSGFG